MLKKLLQGLVYLEQRIKEKLILILPKDSISIHLIVGLCLVPLYYLTEERLVVYLLAAFSITYLIVGVVYLITMTRIYGWRVRVEVSVDIGEMFAVMVLQLGMVLVLLDQFRLCT